jgi:hypothetical protein
MRSWVSFWIGICVGLPVGVLVTAAVWTLTTKAVAPKLRVRSVTALPPAPVRLGRAIDAQGRPTSAFCVVNEGDRDAVGVTVACTLFAGGRSSGERTTAFAVPVTPAQLDVLPGLGRRRRLLGDHRRRSIDTIRVRILTLELHEIADDDTEAVATADRDGSSRAGTPLEALLGRGPDSFLSIAVCGRDSVSGRQVVALQELAAKDVVEVPT